MQDKPQINQRSDQLMAKKNHQPVFSEERMKADRLKREAIEIQEKMRKAQLENESKILEEEDKNKPKIDPKVIIDNLNQREQKFKQKWSESK